MMDDVRGSFDDSYNGIKSVFDSNAPYIFEYRYQRYSESVANDEDKF